MKPAKYWTEGPLGQINPVSGCTKISEACQNCYAEENHRIHHGAWAKYYRDEGPMPKAKFYSRPFSEITLQPEQLRKFDKLSRTRKSHIVFIGNMTDLFHHEVPDSYLYKVFEAMHNCDEESGYRHTFLMLTKRAKRMHDFIEILDLMLESTRLERFEGKSFNKLYPNLFVGVTAENQARADERVPYLLRTPAAHRWISAGPLLGALDISKYLPGSLYDMNKCCLEGPRLKDQCNQCPHQGPFVDLVMAEGESGRNARPMDGDWIEDLATQCHEAWIPFHLKQLGDAFVRDERPFETIGELGLTPEEIFKPRVVA